MSNTIQEIKTNKLYAELIILKFLTEKDMYGYEITQKMISEKVNIDEPSGSLTYPILHRLEQSGLISSSRKVIDKKMRVYYHIEQKGLEYFENLRSAYIQTQKNIKSILNN